MHSLSIIDSFFGPLDLLSLLTTVVDSAISASENPFRNAVEPVLIHLSVGLADVYNFIWHCTSLVLWIIGNLVTSIQANKKPCIIALFLEMSKTLHIFYELCVLPSNM